MPIMNDRKAKRTAANAWIERTNVLRGLTISQAKDIFDVARAHGSPRLQKIYDEIELADPILATCVDRRQAALAQLGWKVTASPTADETLADEQKAALDTFVRGIGNLTEAIEHLDLSFFRGFSVVQPIWENGRVRTVSLLNSWNFLFDDEKNLLWNPEATLDPSNCFEIPASARIVQIRRKRPIDYPALSIHIRKYLGERDWGRFVERYGIPPVDVVMAPNATEEQRADYVEAADRARDGVSTVWPSGSSTSRAEGSRGQDPFSAFIEHQEKLIVLRATGGTLTSLAQADTGSLAGGAQMDVWEQIVSRDSQVISEALNRQIFWRYLEEAFPGQPIAASFEIGKEKEMSAVEAADLAGKLKAAGYTVDQGELEEAVGFTLAKDETPAQPSGFGMPSSAPYLNKKLELEVGVGEREDQFRSPTQTQDSNSVLASFANDTGPAAEAIKALLQDPSKEAAEKLLADLPALLPEDPALAAVIADEMAKQFSAVPSPPSATGADKPLANKDDANGISHSDADGKFDGGNGCGSSDKIGENESSSDDVKTFLKEVPKKIKPEQADKLLTEGFTDHDGAGNNVHYGQLLLDHINKDSRDPNDRDARKRSLGVAMQMIRKTNPVKSSRAGDKERVYFGLVDGKAYIAVADEHSEINAMEMVSYRRDSRRDER